MLWDSAWAEGGGAQIPASALVAIPRPTLQAIYEDQAFVPSVAIGQIDQYLQ